MAENMIDKINRAHGCMLGQLAADALGSLVEFESAEQVCSYIQMECGLYVSVLSLTCRLVTESHSDARRSMLSLLLLQARPSLDQHFLSFKKVEIVI